jgi:hypothetical protein
MARRQDGHGMNTPDRSPSFVVMTDTLTGRRRSERIKFRRSLYAGFSHVGERVADRLGGEIGRALFDEALREGPAGGLGAVGDVELPIDVGQVELDRLLGHP